MRFNYLGIDINSVGRYVGLSSLTEDLNTKCDNIAKYNRFNSINSKRLFIANIMGLMNYHKNNID